MRYAVHPTTQLLAGVVVLCALLATPVSGTSYVMMDDRDLYDQAPAIAQVSVLTVGPAPAQGVPAVDYIVVVERLLKGQIAGTTVVVRVAGGVGPDGWGLEIVGAPRFAEGDRAILFLVPRHDGTYGILHMMLGAFHQFNVGGNHLALRDLQDARDLLTSDSPRGIVAAPRDFDGFAEWLARGAPRGGEYRVVVSHNKLARWHSAFALLRQEQRHLRWFEDQVEWRLGRPAPSGSRRLLKEALRAWSPLAGFRLAYGGRTEADAGLSTFDGVNALWFGDADEVIPGDFSCTRGGVAAVGGPWFDPEVTSKARPGTTATVAIRILGADIMINDGAECLLDGFHAESRDVLLRELGHTLGLGFACGDGLTGLCADDASVMGAMLHDADATPLPGERDRARLQNRP